MSIDTTTSIEQAVDEALSSERPCEAGDVYGCHGNNTARWYGIRTCGCPIDTWCDLDKQMILAWQVADGGQLTCRPCSIRTVIRFEPIR